MKITIGFSPCPNDTFIFDALINNKIDTGGFEFEAVLDDVQTLNKWALEQKLDVTKISYGVLPLLLEKYVVLNSGGALGQGVGPLLIARQQIPEAAISNGTVAIPGENTTAHMLFLYAYPSATRKQFMVFNQIENAVLQATTDMGVIIHENRFTYNERGLVKLIDLGEFWEQQTGAPIPLGGIVIKRSFTPEVQQELDNLIRKSVEYSFANYPAISEYVSRHSQEMSEDVMRRHIDLYVNDYSLNLGAKGKAAVHKLLAVYAGIHGTAASKNTVFIGEG